MMAAATVAAAAAAAAATVAPSADAAPPAATATLAAAALAAAPAAPVPASATGGGGSGGGDTCVWQRRRRRRRQRHAGGRRQHWRQPRPLHRHRPAAAAPAPAAAAAQRQRRQRRLPLHTPAAAAPAAPPAAPRPSGCSGHRCDGGNGGEHGGARGGGSGRSSPCSGRSSCSELGGGSRVCSGARRRPLQRRQHFAGGSGDPTLDWRPADAVSLPSRPRRRGRVSGVFAAAGGGVRRPRTPAAKWRARQHSGAAQTGCDANRAHAARHSRVPCGASSCFDAAPALHPREGTQ